MLNTLNTHTGTTHTYYTWCSVFTRARSSRIRGGLAVETDFIITVKPSDGCGGGGGGASLSSVEAAAELQFEAFTLSKTYSAFRTFALQLKQVADVHQKKSAIAGSDLPAATAAAVVKLTKYCYLVFHLVDAQRTAYLGKVNYLYVKLLAKQRKQIIDDVLSATCNYFPSAMDSASHNSLLRAVTSIVETFFLTDHVVAVDDDALDEGNYTDRSSAAGAPRGHERKHSSPHTSLDNLNPLAWIGAKGGIAAVTTKLAGHKSPSGDAGTTAGPTPAAKPKRPTLSVAVVPMTRRSRPSVTQRDLEEEELRVVGEEAMLLVDDYRPQFLLPNYAKPVPTVRTDDGAFGGTALGAWMKKTSPWTFVAIAVAAVMFLQKAAHCAVTMDGDIFLLCIFASFCLGLHTPRPMIGGFDRPPTMKGTVVIRGNKDLSGRKLLKRSMFVSSPMKAMQKQASITAGITSMESHTVAAAAAAVEDHLNSLMEDEEEEDEHLMLSPMAMFPEGAPIGSHLNCWARPETSEFLVRGPKYLSDKKKVPSGDYLFPCRGVDLFLTDACPQNVGRNPGVMGGHLRDVPTFIINFRLPWGVLLLYCEIPSKFVPFLEASTAGDAAIAKLLPALKEMTPPERTAARWLMNDTEHKNKTLKIVPVIVDGPWVVKSVVGGKPALIGAKLPINYVYQPAEGKDALYLEADLDIVASSAARGILSVARSYTQVLTINLGFVIQGNEVDELPEQMLTGARLHGIDPLTAPMLPMMAEDMALHLAASRSDDESV